MGALILALVGGLVVWQLLAASQRPAASPNSNATATAIARAATPQDLYRAVTMSRPVLTDSLSGVDANRWDENTSSLGGCRYAGGAYQSYVVTRYVAECYAHGIPSFPSTTMFAIQVELAFLQGDGGGGLLFGYRAGNVPYYRFGVRPDGYFDLFDPATGARFSSALDVSPGATQQLRVIVRGSTIYLYINGTYVGRSSLEAGASVDGQLGVFSVDGRRNPTEVAFYNLTVWSVM